MFEYVPKEDREPAERDKKEYQEKVKKEGIDPKSQDAKDIWDAIKQASKGM